MSNIIIILFILFFILITTRIIYYFSTLNELNVKIIKKFKIHINNKEILKIFDENKIEYYLEEDLLITSKKCNQLWNDIVEGKMYTIKFFGLNYHNLNIHFKVIDIFLCKNK